MRKPTFRLIVGPASDGPRNMAVDEAILTAAIEEGDDRPTLRLYGWDPPTLSVGANAIVPDQVFERCARIGVGFVKRPTGGGAVLHDGDMTYSVVAPHGSMGVSETYEFVAQGLIASFSTLGIRAEIATHSARQISLACFAVPTGADIVASGAKIVGSAQVRRSGRFLQHGSIPLSDIRVETARLLGNDQPDKSTFLRAFCPNITWHDAAQALIRGFTEVWGPPERLKALFELQERLAAGLLAKT